MAPSGQRLGVDLTAIEGIDKVHALTFVGEIDSDFTKWPTGGETAGRNSF